MRYLDDLSFGFTRRLPVILQTEEAECGLACIAIIAYYHGYHSDLFSLRQKYPISQKGVTLHTLIKIVDTQRLNTKEHHQC